MMAGRKWIFQGRVMIKAVFWICLALALVTALGYFLLGVQVIHAADLTLEDAPPGFAWLAGAFYVIAGFMVFLRPRAAKIAVAIINLIPIVVFYVMWFDRPDVLTSVPGLMTKIPQVLLEAGLLYLLFEKRTGRSAAAAR